MIASPSIKFVFSSMAIILAIHIAAVSQDWYHSISWIDIVLHILGGAWVTIVFFYVQEWFAPKLLVVAPPWFSFFLVVGFVMFVGVGWEWLEYGYDYFFAEEYFMRRAQLGLPDTIGDLFADFAGGSVAALYGIFTKRNREHITTNDTSK